jgi:hypothetical protein
MISNIINKNYLVIIGFIVIILAIIHLYSQQIELINNYNKLYKKYDDISKNSECLKTEIYLLTQAKNSKPTDTLYEMSYNSKEEENRTPIQCTEGNPMSNFTKGNIEIKNDNILTQQESVNVDVSGIIDLKNNNDSDILETPKKEIILDKKKKSISKKKN